MWTWYQRINRGTNPVAFMRKRERGREDRLILLNQLTDLSGINQYNDTQVLLFVRNERSQTDLVPATSPSLFYYLIYVPLALLINSQVTAHVSPARNPVLELGNQGNSCWVAACCQLLYCVHIHSGRELFSFKQSRELPPCVQVTLSLFVYNYVLINSFFAGFCCTDEHQQH